jgi:hypothetical protein
MSPRLLDHRSSVQDATGERDPKDQGAGLRTAGGVPRQACGSGQNSVQDPDSALNTQFNRGDIIIVLSKLLFLSFNCGIDAEKL